jgi:hypothetical protein
MVQQQKMTHQHLPRSLTIATAEAIDIVTAPPQLSLFHPIKQEDTDAVSMFISSLF